MLLQRQTETKLLQQVQALQKRCAELEMQASQDNISGMRHDHFVPVTADILTVLHF